MDTNRKKESRLLCSRSLALLALAILAGCAHRSVRWSSRSPLAIPLRGPILVLVLPGPALPPPRANFDSHLLQMVRERDPGAQLVHGNENNATTLALERGANFVLITTILRWRDAETQYDGEPDRVDIRVRLMRLRRSETVGEFVFGGRGSPFAIRDAPADRLVNNRFHDAVRQLLASVQPP
jgi:hypothetical protein